MRYDEDKYILLKTIDENKILLLEDKNTKAKVIAKQSANARQEYKNIELLKKVDNIPTLVEYKNDVLYIQYYENVVTLRELVKKNNSFSLELFYDVAFKILKTLEQIHNTGLIHKDLNYENILYDENDSEIYIIDFEFSSSIKNKIDVNHTVEKLNGHISFISPEQTGRVNREVDFRSDFYSLGIIFYYLLTSRVPFEAEDIIGVIHQHITKQALNPKVINKDIPDKLSSFILKLLAKEPENRYQSILGIKTDLEAIKNGLEIKLGQNDYSDKLILKHSQYGRTDIAKELQKIFQSVINNSNKLVTIGGFSGTGKTSVVHELHRSLSQNFGFYGESKFDQLNSPVPYYGIKAILEEYFDFVLKQDFETSSKLKEDLLAKLGAEAFILTSKIKNLEFLLGVQEISEKLSYKEEEDRFYRLFITLMETITSGEKPFLFFIDDLQWADSGTIDLIKLIAQTDSIKNLLVINAYRNNEVNNNHVYMMTLNALREVTSIEEFQLQNLSRPDVAELVTDLTHKQDEQLIDYIFETSLGNAFFINQMIHLFNSENLFSFDSKNKNFNYSLEKLKNIGLSGDVIEIATKNIALLSKEVIEVLKIASVIGNRFDITLLNFILNDNKHIQMYLEKAQEKSFIIKIKERYKFSHDRVQQAFYALIDSKDLPGLHKRIAYELCEHQNEISFFENIKLEIALHYNEALDILSEDEKLSVVSLNLDVAKQIKDALAYEVALKYLDSGLNIIDKSNRELYWEYLFLKTEIYLNTSKIHKIDSLVSLLDALVDSDEKLVALATIVIKKDFILHDHLKVIRYGAEVIKKLGMNIPIKANKLNVMKELATYKYHLRAKEYKDILLLPEIQDNKKFLISKILFDLIPSAYMTNSNLFGTYSLIMANIALKYGNSQYAPFGYIMSALLIGGGFKQFTTAYELGKIALEVSEKYYDLDCYSRVNFLFGCFVLHGVKPYKEYMPYRELSNKGFIQIGNTLFRNYNDFFTRVQHILFNSASLDKIKEENINILDLYKDSNEEDLIHFQTYMLSFLSKLENGINDDSDEIEKKYELYLESQLNTSIKAMVYTFKALEYYLFEDYDKAFVYIKKALKYIDDQLGVMTDHLFRLIFNLIILELKNVNAFYKTVYKLNIFLLKRYAKYSPDNFNLYYYLLLAQEASKKGNLKEASRYFKDSLFEAKKEKSLFHTAFVNELIAKHWLLIDKDISSIYFNEAFKYYTLYKANTKACHLKEKYTFKTLKTENNALSAETVTTTTNTNFNLDVDVVLKASQTISQEIQVENILQKMVHIILENIGANRGFIILNKEDCQFIVASVDNEKIELLSNKNIKDEENISKSIINYVSKTKQIVIVGDASINEKYENDAYIQRNRPKSILAIPMIQNSVLKGILYCENNFISNVFSQKIVSTTSMILSQLIISIDNAFIYDNLELLVNERTQELSNKNKDIRDSIEYASLIQQAIFPDESILNNYFNDSFIFWRPKDVVGGDIYFITELESKEEILVIVIDGAGHGVPGAFVTILVKAIETQLLADIAYGKLQPSPAIILAYFNKSIKTMLKQEKGSQSNVGFDGGVLYYNKATNECKYAGGKIDLYKIENDALEIIKSDRKNVGFIRTKIDQTYTEHAVEIKPNTKLYMLTDGFYDQHCEKDKIYGKKEFERLLIELNQKTFAQQKEELQNTFENFKGKAKQNDDVSVVGLGF